MSQQLCPGLKKIMLCFVWSFWGDENCTEWEIAQQTNELPIKELRRNESARILTKINVSLPVLYLIT